VYKKTALVAILTMTLVACGAPRTRPNQPQSLLQPSASLQSLPAPGTYQIDFNNSELRILVYRAGPLANLGHNHVLVNRNLSGSVQLADSLSASSFSLSLPVSEFVVDDAQARQEEGADFPGIIPDDAKSGTLHNMLGAAVLNAAAYPVITVKSVSIVSEQGGLTATVSIGIAGREAIIAAPFTLQGDTHHLTGLGSFEIRQTALGLTPYSLMRGALQVEDAMQLKIRVTAAIN
jgi:YceI-like domain